jgi:hypothetical protein
MEQQAVRAILKQISDGNSEFDTNSAQVTRILGIEPTHNRSEGEAALLRYHLENLESRGYIRVPVKSTANFWMADLTPTGVALLRSLGG